MADVWIDDKQVYQENTGIFRPVAMYPHVKVY